MVSRERSRADVKGKEKKSTKLTDGWARFLDRTGCDTKEMMEEEKRNMQTLDAMKNKTIEIKGKKRNWEEEKKKGRQKTKIMMPQ